MMVRSFEFHKSASFKLRKMFEMMKNQPSGAIEGRRMSPLSKASTPRLIKDGDATDKPQSSDRELIKERFAKLLLGEDMSGRGKGVSSALALTNAITNLGGCVIGEQRKLEPMKAERKERWRKEVEWLLSVTDHIVQLVPSQQQSADGTMMEVMASRQRSDLLDNIPALRKLDAMLMECLDSFGGENEFWYVELNDVVDDSGKKNSASDWWIPVVKVPANGLSEISQKWLQHQKEAVNQVLKAALAINAEILSEMEIPDTYMDTLPKNGKASLGDAIYKSITDEGFEAEQLLGSMDLSSEEKVVDLKNKIEASIVIWKKKMVQKDGKSSWGSIVSLEKRELFEDRAETLLQILKHYFPGIPQSSLDLSKIEYNQDVGRAVLEGYSRVLESFACAVMCLIDQVLHADSVARNLSLTDSNKKMAIERISCEAPAGPVTLLDFMGWSVEQGDDPNKMKTSNDFDAEEKLMIKTPPQEAKRMSYLDRLEILGGMRSPTARH